MKICVVGGAVRDNLLGLPVTDRDYVVVGATPEEMIAQGFVPVGQDFPVFLHPVTHEEYALARTERKSGQGYKGFMVYATPTVTLEEDLGRRDFTVNAMAKCEEDELIDPYGGLVDLRARVLRHVGVAFVEDPVRILRGARFMARFIDFKIADETMHLMRRMVADGEVTHWVAERVWQELARGLMSEQPSRMFETLRECGALAHIMPELDILFGVPQDPEHHPEVDTGIHTMMVVDAAASQEAELAVRFAALLHDVGKGLTPAKLLPKHSGHELAGLNLVRQICKRLRVPSACKDLALLATRYHGDIHRVLKFSADDLVRLLESVDAFRRPERFSNLLQVCLADVRGRTGYAYSTYPQAERLRAALAGAKLVNVAEIAARVGAGEIAIQAHQARVSQLITMGV